MSPHLQAADPSELLAVFALLIVLLTATLAFTDKDRVMMLSIADDRAVQESEESLPDRETARQLLRNASACRRAKPKF